MRTMCTLSTALAFGCGTGTESPLVSDETHVALDEVLESAVAGGEVPGVVAIVVDRDTVLYRGAAGVMDAEGARAMRPDALFRIASMTKPITSVAIMILVEEGVLSLDAPASDYLPELEGREVLVSVDADNSSVATRPVSRPITIRDLLRHTSGFGYSFSSPALLEVSRGTSIPARAQPILHDPGTKWTYGMGTAFLGWIIEEVSGQSLPEFLTSRVTGPLGMDDTSFDLAPENRDRLVAMYSRGDAGLAGEPNPDEYQPEIRGDGGLLSTASDYARFVQLILGGGARGEVRILEESSIAEMTQDQLEGITVVEQPAANPTISNAFPLGAGRDGFGLGFQISVGESVGGRPPGTLSWAGIANTHFWIDPANGIGVVLLLQLLPFYDDRAVELLTTFERALYSGFTRAER
jgi:CubicO group peptidase (beta-lactamase class C family)